MALDPTKQNKKIFSKVQTWLATIHSLLIHKFCKQIGKHETKSKKLGAHITLKSALQIAYLAISHYLELRITKMYWLHFYGMIEKLHF